MEVDEFEGMKEEREREREPVKILKNQGRKLTEAQGSDVGRITQKKKERMGVRVGMEERSGVRMRGCETMARMESEESEKWGGGWKKTKIKKKGKESFFERVQIKETEREMNGIDVNGYCSTLFCSTVVSKMLKRQNCTKWYQMSMQDGATQHTQLTAKAIQLRDTCTVCVCVSLSLSL